MVGVQWVVKALTPDSQEMSGLHPTYVTYIPLLAFIYSILHVFCCKAYRLLSKPDDDNLSQDDDFVNHASTSDASSPKKTLDAYDGLAIITYRTIRLACCIILFCLQLQDPLDIYSDITDFAMVFFYAYVSLLAVRTIFSTPFWRDFYSRQLSSLLLVDFLTSFYLNIWPLCIVGGYPHDFPERSTFRPRAIALAICAVFVPFSMPRPFRSSTEKPGVEDTASWISIYTFLFIQSTLLFAYKAKQVSTDDLPPISEKRTAETLNQRIFKYLDPLLVGKKQYFMRGMLRGFRKSYIIMALLMTAQSVTTFAGAYGMKNLLLYVERGEYVFGVKPWVWILVMASGPFISSTFHTHFMGYSMRQATETESVVTQLVFEHSLRIRIRGDILGKEKEKDTPSDTSQTAPSTVIPVVAEESAPSSDNAMDSGVEADVEEELLKEVEDATHEVAASTEKPRTAHLIGRINSLVTTDLLDVTCLQNLLRLPAAFLQTCIAIVFLYDIMGWSALVGLVAMIILFPIPAKLSKMLVGVIKETKAKTDKRVQVANDSLNVLRMVKLFAWEPFMHKKLGDVRDEEMRQIRRMRFLEILIAFVSEALPLVAKIVIFAIYALVMKREVTASVVFSALMVFGILEARLWYMLQMLPEALKSLATFDRYTEFLNETELLPSAEKTLDSSALGKAPAAAENEIGFNNCSFSWGPSLDGPQNDASCAFKLSFGNKVVFKRGAINLVLGPTASGKTSLLMALLGEMYYKPNGPDSWYNLPRNDGVAYAAQESWVLNETVRTNVVFGHLFDQERYNKVIKQCALEQDLSLWKAGDMTEVGEKGITLSGGQKARLTLARALYSPASIVLLDDVLAALDVHTAKHVVNEALQGDLVRGRTILLVTHNIALTAPIAETALILGRNGKVVRRGTVADVLLTSAKLRAVVEKQKERNDEGELKEMKEGEADEDNKDADAGKLIVAEEKAVGKLRMAAVVMYLRAFGNPAIWTFCMFLICVCITSDIAQTWFVGLWSSQYEDHPSSEIRVLWYFSIYITIATLAVLLDFTRKAFFLTRSTGASVKIHYQLIDSLLKAPFRWFDVTPAGRILTRCTQDIGQIDGWLPYLFAAVTYQAIMNTSLFVIAVTKAGIYALIPGLVLVVIGGFLSHMYLKAQINVRREMSLRKAPILSQLGVVLAGLQSIRAYEAKNFFRQELNKRIDDYVRASLVFYDLNRWVSVRLDFLGAVFAGAVAAYLVYGSTVTAGSVGFILSLVLRFSQSILELVRMYNGLEQYATSLERVLDYLQIEHEEGLEHGETPPAYWPASGNLRVENLSAKYSDDSPDVLKGISFEVKAGERIGVVGRNGAGKSTIALALLRAVKTSGKVYYDGVATDEITLQTLRSKITLIPQQPELIRGTLRENLDPFGEHEDAFLNHALNASQLHSVKDLRVGGAQGQEPLASDQQLESKINLDTVVQSGGTNFSMGQRQIIALARAIVRKSKLLILDEATAAIDFATDAAIQKTLRTEFGTDTTLITIAHRLHTIMDYDRIMVLDAGCLVEFDSPNRLLEKKEGLFRALVDESEDKDALGGMIKGH